MRQARRVVRRHHRIYYDLFFCGASSVGGYRFARGGQSACDYGVDVVQAKAIAQFSPLDALRRANMLARVLIDHQ